MLFFDGDFALSCFVMLLRTSNFLSTSRESPCRSSSVFLIPVVTELRASILLSVSAIIASRFSRRPIASVILGPFCRILSTLFCTSLISCGRETDWRLQFVSLCSRSLSFSNCESTSVLIRLITSSFFSRRSYC